MLEGTVDYQIDLKDQGAQDGPDTDEKVRIPLPYYPARKIRAVLGGAFLKAVPHNVAPIDGVVTVFTNRSRTDEVKPMLPDGVT